MAEHCFLCGKEAKVNNELNLCNECYADVKVLLQTAKTKTTEYEEQKQSFISKHGENTQAATFIADYFTEKFVHLDEQPASSTPIHNISSAKKKKNSINEHNKKIISEIKNTEENVPQCTTDNDFTKFTRKSKKYITFIYYFFTGITVIVGAICTIGFVAELFEYNEDKSFFAALISLSVTLLCPMIYYVLYSIPYSLILIAENTKKNNK